jgi:hypothetical protein
MTLDTIRHALANVPMAVYILASGFLFFVWYIARQLRAHKVRSKDVRDWCQTAGFHYEEGPVPASDLAPMQFLLTSPPPTANATTSRETPVEAQRIATGSRDGWAVRVFDESRTYHSHDHGKTSWTTRFRTWVLVSCRGCELPRLSFSALYGDTSLGARLIGTFVKLSEVAAGDGSGNVRLAGHPGLFLSSDNPERARALFEPLAEFFRDQQGLFIEAQGPWLLVGRDPRMAGSGWNRGPLIELVATTKYEELIATTLQVAEHLGASDDDHFLASAAGSAVCTTL